MRRSGEGAGSPHPLPLLLIFHTPSQFRISFWKRALKGLGFWAFLSFLLQLLRTWQLSNTFITSHHILSYSHSCLLSTSQTLKPCVRSVSFEKTFSAFRLYQHSGTVDIIIPRAIFATNLPVGYNYVKIDVPSNTGMVVFIIFL